MKPKHQWQIPIAAGLIAYFCIGYLGINAFNTARGFSYSVAFAWEKEIPYVAPFILGYSMVYTSILFIYFMIPGWAIFKKMAWGFFWVMTIHYIFFLLFPVEMVWRPEITEIDSLIDWLAKLIFSIDKTYNCFPSLHVAFPTLTAVLSWRFVPKWHPVFIAMAFITAVSVVFVKQHYILDAVAGGLVALVVGALIPRKSFVDNS